jgi:hypothetical protein
MQMKAINIMISVSLLLLIGCTAVTTPEALEETAVPPQTSIPEELPVNDETPETDPTPTNDDKQVSEPVTVDLGSITPETIGGTPIVQPAPGNPGLKEPVVQAMTDLSQRLNVGMDDIELVSLLEVTWPDGSLGCPQPGMAYTQALVPGQQMIFRVAGEAYYYHSGRGSEFVYCSDPQPPVEGLPINPSEPVPGQDD